MAKTIAEIETRSGSVVRMIETDNGQIRYQSFNNARTSDGQFIPNSQGKELFDIANDKSEGGDVTYSLSKVTQRDRENALAERYSEWNNTKGITQTEARKHSESDPIIERLTKIWIDNPQVSKQIKNDPLVDSRNRRKAQEAYARAMAKEIENAENEGEVVQILRSYGIES